MIAPEAIMLQKRNGRSYQWKAESQNSSKSTPILELFSKAGEITIELIND